MKLLQRKINSSLFPTAVLAVVILVLSLIPLVLIAKYDHPCADDYRYGLLASQAWKSGSISNVFSAAGQTVHDAYFEWQGTFSGIFLMALQPAIFGENLYFLTPIVIMTAFLISTFVLFQVVLIRYLNADKYSYIIICCVIAGLSLHFMPSPVEGLFWYNGAIYYTFFYSLSLILVSLILLFYQSNHLLGQLVYSLFIGVLGLIVGGGNFTAALVTAVVLVYILIYGIVLKKKRFLIAALALACELFGLMISATAPGNAVRQTYFLNRPTALGAVLQSFRTALVSIFQWTGLPVIVCMVFLIPIIYKIVRASDFLFPRPWLMPIMSFCAFSAQFTPPLYALGFSGPTRLLNVIYYSYYIFLLVNLFYIIGWISKQLQKNDVEHAELALFRKISILVQKNLLPVLSCFALLFAIGCISTNNVRKITGVSAFLSLRNGQATQYDREAIARLTVYDNPSLKQSRVNAFSAKPYVLYFNDIEPDKSNWRNVAVAKFYNKESVVRNVVNKK